MRSTSFYSLGCGIAWLPSSAAPSAVCGVRRRAIRVLGCVVVVAIGDVRIVLVAGLADALEQIVDGDRWPPDSSVALLVAAGRSSSPGVKPGRWPGVPGPAGAVRRGPSAVASQAYVSFASGFVESLGPLLGELGEAACDRADILPGPCRARSAIRRRGPGRSGRGS